MSSMLNPDNAFKNAVSSVLRKVELTIQENRTDKIDIVLVGEAATHYYTRNRLPNELEFISNKRFILPPNIRVLYEKSDVQHELSLSANFVSSISLLHPDAIEDSIFYETLGRFSVKVLSPIDLAVTKIGRFARIDRQDVQELAKIGLLDEEKVRSRTEEALRQYIGDTALKQDSLRDALEDITEIRGLLRKDEPSSDEYKP